MSFTLPPFAPTPEALEIARAQVLGTPAQEVLEVLIQRQLSAEQEYFVLTVELMRAQQVNDEPSEEALTDRLDALWWPLTSEVAERIEETNLFLTNRYHEIFMASQAYRQEQEHRKLDEDASKPDVD